MDTNTELLNYIFQNSQMGIQTIGQLLDIVEEDSFKKQLESELKEYRLINQKARDILTDLGCDEKGITQMDKFKAYIMINMQTLTDKSASHISEMMITGSTMGIIEATKKIKEYVDTADKNIVGLMKDLLKFEEKNIESLKEYL
ncbi:hypothetical protein [Anaerosporobacter sp.]|uniref:hypothetical protein n=1 Tax=Anaerosporobacter sp. TaxID=1872529 RepID=UPI00286F43AC|nr:hypothetical protein [Anaerosporobacter sp.]